MHWDEIERRARDRIGRTLCGKWTLDALLGVGGTSSVYAATHRNGAPLAIKVLHPAVSAIPEIAARFLREGYLANRVRHPAIVGVLDDSVDEVEGVAFLVMERVDGASLAERAAERLFSEEQLLDVAAQTLAALVVAHASGVVHRDLKPENLLVDGSGGIRILDFGIARLLDVADDGSGSTVVGAICGTPGFLAPEQARGDRDAITARTDLFSLGATLFALATGRPPHVGATEQQELLRAASQQAPNVRDLAPNLPEEVAAIIDRALRFAAAERWPSATEMLRAVRRIRHARGFSRRTLAFASGAAADSFSSMPPPPLSSAPESGVDERRSVPLHDAPTLTDSCGAIAVEAADDGARLLSDSTLRAPRPRAVARARGFASAAVLACALLGLGRLATSSRAETGLVLSPVSGVVAPPALATVPGFVAVAPRTPVAPLTPVEPEASPSPSVPVSAHVASAVSAGSSLAAAAATASLEPPRRVRAAPAAARAPAPTAAPSSPSAAPTRPELRSERADVAVDVVPGYRESPY